MTVRMVAIVLLLLPRAGSGVFASDDSLQVLLIDVRGLEALREGAKGRVLLVNVWATWCVPCIEEFPDILKLRKTFGAEGLDVAFISVDDQKSVKREVLPFLKKMGVDFTTYIKKAGDDETFIDAINPDWRGAVPATFLYNRSGKMVSFQTEALTYDELSAAVKPLLKANP